MPQHSIWVVQRLKQCVVALWTVVRQLGSCRLLHSKHVFIALYKYFDSSLCALITFCITKNNRYSERESVPWGCILICPVCLDFSKGILTIIAFVNCNQLLWQRETFFEGLPSLTIQWLRLCCPPGNMGSISLVRELRSCIWHCVAKIFSENQPSLE